MNVFTIKNIILSTAIASVFSVSAFAQTQAEGSADASSQARSPATHANEKQLTTAVNGAASGSGNIRVGADSGETKEHGESTASKSVTNAEQALSSITSNAAKAAVATKTELEGGLNVLSDAGASTRDQAEMGAAMLLETADGVALTLSSSTQASVAAAAELGSYAQGSATALANATANLTAGAQESLSGVLSESAASGADFSNRAGGAADVDADMAASIGADAFGQMDSTHVLDSLSAVGTGIEDALAHVSADAQEAAEFELDGTGMNDDLAGEISGQIQGSAGVVGGLGL